MTELNNLVEETPYRLYQEEEEMAEHIMCHCEEQGMTRIPLFRKKLLF